MASIKTAISLQESIFERVDELAREMKTSRSHVVAEALEEYFLRHENRELLRRLDTAYADFPDQEEQALLRQMRRQYPRIAEDEC